MRIVGLDTSCRVGGVAVVEDGALLGAEVLGVEEGHSTYLIPALERLLNSLDLDLGAVDGIAASVGPGSYTGLRIGLAVAKGLAYARRIPLCGVSTLLATAWAYRGIDAVVCASLDARRESVFCGFFEGRRLGGEALLGDEARLDVSDVCARIDAYVASGRSVVLVGNGSPIIHASLKDPSKVVRAPLDAETQRPAHVAHIGELRLSEGRSDDPFGLVPNYLRPSEAERRWKLRHS